MARYSQTKVPTGHMVRTNKSKHIQHTLYSIFILNTFIFGIPSSLTLAFSQNWISTAKTCIYNGCFSCCSCSFSQVKL